MKSVEIQGNLRTELGSKYAQLERKAGNVPCVVYGSDAPIHFSAPVLTFRGLVYTADAKIAKITIGGSTIEAVIQDMQFHPVTDALMHIDSIQLIEGKPVTMGIPVVVKGQSKGVLNGGKMKMIMRKLSIRSIPGSFPESIELDVTPLTIGQSIRVSDVSAEGCEILNAGTAVILTVKNSRGAVKEDGEDEDEGEAEAEVAAE